MTDERIYSLKGLQDLRKGGSREGLQWRGANPGRDSNGARLRLVADKSLQALPGVRGDRWKVQEARAEHG